jgi:hypothetical protein
MRIESTSRRRHVGFRTLIARIRRRNAPHRPSAGTPDRLVRKREVTQLVRRLELPDPFDLDAMVAEAAEAVGAPILLAPYPAPTVRSSRKLGEPLPAALCIATPGSAGGTGRFHVFYRDDTTEEHRVHSVLHELGHILCGHITAHDDVALDDLDAATITKATHRSAYSDDLERAAEHFAYAVGQRRGRLHAGDRLPADPEMTPVVDRYGSILEG